MRHLLILLLNDLQAKEYHKGYITASDIKALTELSGIGYKVNNILLALYDLRLIKCCGNGRYKIQFDPDKLTDEELDYILSEIESCKDEDETTGISEEEWNAISLLINKGYTVIKNR